MNSIVRNFPIVMVLFIALAVSPSGSESVYAQAEEGVELVESTGGVYNSSGVEGAVVHGYDVVAYHLLNRPVKGSPEFAVEWDNATWHFANVEHRDLFVEEPERYAPQYGGFCAYAVSYNGIADVDPSAFEVVDDKLYLNFSRSVQIRWARRKQKHIENADRNWPEVQSRVR